MKDHVSESIAASKAKWQVELAKHINRGRKYLDIVWDSIHRQSNAKDYIPWGAGRIKLWLAPRLGLPPWLALEVWEKYATERKAAGAAKTAGGAPQHGHTAEQASMEQATGKASQDAADAVDDSRKSAAPHHGAASHAGGHSGDKGKHRK